MRVIDWLGVSDTTFRFLVEPSFIMFAGMHLHIFVAHSYYNRVTPCADCTVLLCLSIHNSKEEFVPYLTATFFMSYSSIVSPLGTGVQHALVYF